MSISQIDSGVSDSRAGLHRPISWYYEHADHACAAFERASQPGGSPVVDQFMQSVCFNSSSKAEDEEDEKEAVEGQASASKKDGNSKHAKPAARSAPKPNNPTRPITDKDLDNIDSAPAQDDDLDDE